MTTPEHEPTAADDGGVPVVVAVPESVEIHPRHLRVGSDYVASFAVTGYPREVGHGWLQPLLTHPGRVDVSVHIDPIAPATAADRLRRQLAKFEASRQHRAEHGRLADPETEAATHDAHELAARLARGEGRLFRVGLYLTVHAASESALTEEVSALRALTASLLLEATPTTYRALAGWTSCLPMGLDRLATTRTFDTAALAAGFPFTSPELPAPDPTTAARPTGVLYGLNLGSQGLVHWDRFALDNHNAVILGRSGAGKSYLVKLEALRSLYRGVQVAILDPEDEYHRLADAVGGTHLPLGTDGFHLNPLDLPVHTRPDGSRTAPADALTRRSLFTHTLAEVLLTRTLTARERATLDQAVTATYRAAGITDNPGTWRRPAPLLCDLHATLAATGSDTAMGLADELRPFTHGAFSGLFDGPTTVQPDGHLVVFGLRDLPEETRTAGTLLALDAVWGQVTQPGPPAPRLVVVDEAWQLLQHPAGARFLLRAAKSGRKHWAGLTVATQDVGDVLGSEVGTAVVANSATQILLRQAPQVADQVAATFGLSDGERRFLLAADTGCALVSAGTHRVAFQALASDVEHSLITTDPADLTYAGQDDAHRYVDLT